jgi:hypothetical protein
MQMQNVLLMEKYHTFIKYIYPMLINMSGKHHVLRDKTLSVMFDQIGLFNDALKSNQNSKLFMADSGLATLKEYMRLLSDNNVKLLSKRQYETASVLLSEVCKILGAWISKPKKGAVE